MTCEEFITARLDEDEASVINGNCRCEGDVSRPDCPDRVLRQVAALRAVMSRYEESYYRADMSQREWDIELARLAAIWSDHPDYDPEWSLRDTRHAEVPHSDQPIG